MDFNWDKIQEDAGAIMVQAAKRAVADYEKNGGDIYILSLSACRDAAAKYRNQLVLAAFYGGYETYGSPEYLFELSVCRLADKYLADSKRDN